VNRLETGHNRIVKDVEELREEISEIKDDNGRLEAKLDRMFDTLLKIIDKFNK
jgi:predicted nuclease with TOPRIM domain